MTVSGFLSTALFNSYLFRIIEAAPIETVPVKAAPIDDDGGVEAFSLERKGQTSEEMGKLQADIAKRLHRL